jgi:LysM repeat protein
VRGEDWRRYAAPAAFLLAATIAVILIRSGLQAGGSSPATTGPAPVTVRKTVSTATTTTSKTTPTKATARFWTVQAGDTFGVISSKTGVPVATIEQLNPNVKSTSLFIGEKIKLR